MSWITSMWRHAKSEARIPALMFLGLATGILGTTVYFLPIRLGGDIVWVVAAVQMLSLMIIYGFGSPWWQSSIGRAFFAFNTALMLIMAWIAITSLELLDFYGDDRVRSFLAVLVILTHLNLSLTVLRLQRAGPEEVSDDVT